MADFTRQYELSKTLRFELRSEGNTGKMLIDDEIFSVDGVRKEKYEKVKLYFDRLHREFVDESLRDIAFGNTGHYFNIFREWQDGKKNKENLRRLQKDKKNKENLRRLQKEEKILRKVITKRFDDYAKFLVESQYSHLKLKNKDKEMLFEEGVFALLSDRYGSEEEAHLLNKETGEVVTLFDDWKGFTGYFKKFFETRKNFYTDDGKATAIATRAIDQNLRRFCDNILTFERLQGKIGCTEIEKCFGRSMRDIFSMDAYEKCVLQKGIDDYNRIIGGETLKNGEKKRGVNELVNEYRQNHKGEKLPFLKTLDKQILSEKEKMIFGMENIEQCMSALSKFHENAVEKMSILRNLLQSFVEQNEMFDMEKVYLSREALNTISHRWMSDGHSFESLLFDVFSAMKNKSAKYNKNDDSYSFPDFISFHHIRIAFEKNVDSVSFWKSRYYENADEEGNRGILSGDEGLWRQFLLIFGQEFGHLFRNEGRDIQTGKKYEIGYDVSLPKFEQFLNSASGKIEIDAEEKIIIKNFADDVLFIYQMGKYFSLEKKRLWNMEYELDPLFYLHPETGYMQFHTNAYESIVQKYNDLRNYLTKKTYSEEKWKLNFQNPTLAAGWDKNQESDNSAVILRKDGRYYLGLMRKGHTHLFVEKYQSQVSEDSSQGQYEKMVYKYIKDIVTGIPKSSTQMKEVVEHFKESSDDYILEKGPSIGKFVTPLIITEEVFNLNNKIFLKTNLNRAVLRGEILKKEEKNHIKLFQKDFVKLGGDPTLYKKSLLIWIDFCKKFLESYPSCTFFDYSRLKESIQYESLDEFYEEINSLSYVISFDKISQEYIEKQNAEGNLYLFEIYNQDFAIGKTGKKNLHTMYWEGLFSVENTNGFPLKLNGEAEIFYRPKSIEAEREKRCKSKRDIIKNKRYTEDKIFFHCPITLNRGKGEAKYFNQEINDVLANNENINIIGVDRGEKHLAYYSVINQKQEILESGSLNSVGGKNLNGEIVSVDYAEKLERKANEREQARRDWQSVEGIKDLKKGYVSQVVRKLADLAIQYNAIIVLEDLNMRFKQIRGGIEKSIYQKLEKALIDKLSFLVEKGEIDPKKAGHLLNAYQLTAPFESFQKMGKQTGILFYTQASYTSKIDPLSGWRPNLYLKHSNAKKDQAIISQFSSILYNTEKNRFEFTYDVKKFQTLKEWPKNTVWTICSSVERFRWNRTLNQHKGGYDHYTDMTEQFDILFKSYKIDIRSDIRVQIMNLEAKGNEKFFADFIFFFNLVCQIRNTDPLKEKDDPLGDFILSPVAPFFDSRKAEDFGKNLPKNGDDNGAYNIARKGIIILDKISAFKEKEGSCKDLKWGDLYVSQSEWDTFAQMRRETKK